MHRVWTLAMGMGVWAAVLSADLVIDGDLSDWSEANKVAMDPRGDATGSFDLTQVWAHSNGSTLYLKFDIGEALNLQSGEEGDGTLKLSIRSAATAPLAIDFRKRILTLGDAPLPWSAVRFACLPTYAASEFELMIDLARAELSAGDKVLIQFGGSDRLRQPIELTLQESTESHQEAFALPRTKGIRIANLNTLNEGLSDPERSSSIKRLLEASRADIYCVQEEWDEAKYREAAPRIIPRQGERDLNVAWSSGRGIATEWSLERLPIDLANNLACLVTSPNDDSLVVINIHLKCCGSATGEEDARRIEQAKQLAAGIRAIRSGQYGEKARTAGVVLVGDYNLVGSRKPVNILEASGVRALPFTATDGGAAYTWRGINGRESFYPGRLDWLTYDFTKLRSTRSVIVDTARMSDSELGTLNLQANDSLASDHLMLVADFVVVR